MLIVVEGISAAGKTTWCRKHASGFTVSETGPRDDAARKQPTAPGLPPSTAKRCRVHTWPGGRAGRK